MIDLGTVKPGSTIRIPFSTFDKDDGSSITMTNYAAADILVYKDGSTTERSDTTGFTATTDFDGKTGKHLAIINLADNTVAGFFAAGSEYLVALDALTVDAVTTGGWIARFRIGYDGAVLDTTIATLASQTSFTLAAGPAEDDAFNGCVVRIHDVASAVQTGFGVVADYTGATKTVTLSAGVSFTAAATDNISFFPPTTINTPALTGVGTYIGDILVGVTLRKMWNSNALASITRGTNGTISVYKNNTTTQSTMGVTDVEDFDGLTGVHLIEVDTSADSSFYQVDNSYEVVLAGATIDGKTINATLFSFTIAQRSCATGAAVSAAIAAELAAVGVTSLRMSYLTGDCYAILSHVAHGNAALKVLIDAITTAISNIQSRLPAALVGGRIDAHVGAMAANVMTAAAAAADLTTELQTGLATASSLTTLDSKADAILADTNELQTDLVNGGRLDLLIDAIKAKTDLLIVDVATIATRLLTAVELDGAVYRFTTNALEQSPAGGGGGSTAQAILEYDISNAAPADINCLVSLIRYALNKKVYRETGGAYFLDVYKENGTDVAFSLPVTLATGPVQAPVATGTAS